MVDETWNPELKQWLSERSSAIGFSRAGIVALGAPDDPAEDRDASRFESWIDAGRAGEMDYLKRRDSTGRLLRGSVSTPHPWANSAVVCALNYNTPGPLSVDAAPNGSGWIARYAWSGRPHPANPLGDSAVSPPVATDYHDFLLAQLQHLADELRARVGGASKCYVDTGPIVERSRAARAGIGWIGKNTCLLNQEEGSWLLLGVILSDLHLPSELASLLSADRCGSCTRCIDACPTDALIEPNQMDASRCIAYLTIEKKGSIPEDLRSLMGRQIFGCDICQDVCPWNRRTRATGSPLISARQQLINPDLGWIAAMDAPTFKRWFKSSPLERTRRSRLHRNVAIAMGNSGDSGFLPQLKTWSLGDDPVLAEAAKWALDSIARNQTGGDAVEDRALEEPPAVPVGTLC
ncbi:MAG: tRNA epoxyqueuosine(34) reductase QueG [Acidobacteriaceae bacterium]